MALPAQWVGKNGRFQLGAPQFLVLVGILAGLLGLVATVLLVHFGPV